MKKFVLSACLLVSTAYGSELLYAPLISGCCSSHGGVCGCSPGGREECCDGSLSPTCTCSVPPATNFTVTPYAGIHGSISPNTATLIAQNSRAMFRVTADAGYTAKASGCSGLLSYEIYTTGPITGNCAVTAMFSASVVCGDANGDRVVDIADALTIARQVVGIDPIHSNTAEVDVNGDNSITIVDALMVARHVAGLPTTGTCFAQ